MKLNLQARVVPGWAKLAWVASMRRGEATVMVCHGPMVEVRPDWCVEAVWAGPFHEGGFDRTDLVFGSGIRCRDDRVVFVSSGATVDRLWHVRRDDRVWVSNSLPAILAAAELSLREDHHYFHDIRSICHGLNAYQRSIPVTGGDVHVIYFHNLSFDGTDLCEIEKPDAAPSSNTYKTYDTYVSFLLTTADQLGANMRDTRRRAPIVPLTGLSSGYDSIVAAIVAMRAGCKQAVTIRQSASLWRGSDSGAHIADYLGLSCQGYDRNSRLYRDEYAVWAISGRAGILNWTQFDYPTPLCAFFSGCRGDMVWDRSEPTVDDPFTVPSVSDMGLAEFRLLQGVYHVVVPFWGLRHVNQIRAISLSEEMLPWTVGGNYDRPIARRMIEDAGVPRGTFATRKKNSSTESYFTWPHTAEAQASLKVFLLERGIRAPSDWLVPVLRRVVALDRFFYLNVTSRLRLPDVGLRLKLRYRANRLLFHWGNEVLKTMYKEGLDNMKNENVSEVTEPLGRSAQGRAR